MAAALSTYNVGGLSSLRGRAVAAVRCTTSISVRGCLTHVEGLVARRPTITGIKQHSLPADITISVSDDERSADCWLLLSVVSYCDRAARLGADAGTQQPRRQMSVPALF